MGFAFAVFLVIVFLPLLRHLGHLAVLLARLVLFGLLFLFVVAQLQLALGL
jgi:hypothetical protein